MKTKLTLSVDQAVVARAKRIARERKVPLSRLVEDHFAVIASSSLNQGGDTFVSRWRGAGKAVLNNDHDERFEAIRAKHVR